MHVGPKGSLVSVVTNKKIENKQACIKEMSKEALKDTIKLKTLTLGAAGAAAVASVKSEKFAGFLSKIKHTAGTILNSIEINGANVKEVITGTQTYATLNALPKPAKAAIAAGLSAWAVLTPIALMKLGVKQAYIEGKHETK